MRSCILIRNINKLWFWCSVPLFLVVSLYFWSLISLVSGRVHIFCTKFYITQFICVDNLRSCLDFVKTEWYNSIFIIHNSKYVEPTEELLFWKISECCFYHSKLKKFEFEWWELKKKFRSFQILKKKFWVMKTQLKN